MLSKQKNNTLANDQNEANVNKISIINQQANI